MEEMEKQTHWLRTVEFAKGLDQFLYIHQFIKKERGV